MGRVHFYTKQGRISMGVEFLSFLTSHEVFFSGHDPVSFPSMEIVFHSYLHKLAIFSL
jgi:hypothetical protein